MKYVDLETLTLNLFDKENKKHLEFIKKLCKDESIQRRFQGITVGLLNNPKKAFFGYGFLVSHDDRLIGYIGVSEYHEQEKSVYLRIAIDFGVRGHSYGKTLLSEITDYIFQTYEEVEHARLKIASDNVPSLKMAMANGFHWIEGELYEKDNPYLPYKKV